MCAQRRFCANDELLTGAPALLSTGSLAPLVLFLSGKASVLFACLSKPILAPDGTPHGG